MQRLGRKNRAFFRISAVDERVRRDGPVIEQLGWYDPIAKDAAKQLQLNEERVKYWLGVGAQPSATVSDVLAKRNLLSARAKKAWDARRDNERKTSEANKAKAAAAAAADEKKDEKKG
jgi:small subunit ribosomal protein S16